VQKALIEPMRVRPEGNPIGKRKSAEQEEFRALIPPYLKKPASRLVALTDNRILGFILPGLFVGVRGTHESTVKVLSGEYKQFGQLTAVEIEREGLPTVNAAGQSPCRTRSFYYAAYFHSTKVCRCVRILSRLYSSPSFTDGLSIAYAGTWVRDEDWVFVLFFEKYGYQASDSDLTFDPNGMPATACP
jgi:hypothetical protein